MSLRELARLSRRELGRIHAAGAAPRVEDLVGWEFRGFNPPAFAKALGIQKFVKGFVPSDAPGRDALALGYNVWVSQRDWTRRRRRGRDLRHGWFAVRPGHRRFNGTLVLDYAASPRNRPYNPERMLFDVLVQPDPGDRDVYLGKAYFRLGPLVPVSFFLIERDREAAP